MLIRFLFLLTLVPSVFPLSIPAGPVPPLMIVALTVYSDRAEVSGYIGGTYSDLCIGKPIYVYNGLFTTQYPPPELSLIGHGTINPDYSFTIHLSTPPPTGKIITAYLVCSESPFIGTTMPAVVQPPIIPEPTTILLVGSGLTALGLKVLRNRRR